MPLQVQFYIGFYNKKLFQQAGLDPNAPPTTWDELFAACAKIKATGVTCIQQGTQNLSGEFYPWYDLTYMMAGILSPQEWEGLYNGKVPWTDPRVTAQTEKWHKLYTDGYVNQDALTATNVMQPFIKGKAAMIIKINNDAGPFTDALGNDVGIFIPPFSDTPVKGVDEFAGNGLAITTYSRNKAAAAEFIKFLTTQQAGQIVADGGLIPAVKGVGPSNPLAKDMLALVNDKHLAVYPMLDNVLPPSLVDVGTTVFPSILVGGVSVQEGLAKMQDAWQKLPASERGSSWAGYQVP
jgi:ABC-type glycerol-3-phosphate transport system substrate-binding protein